MSTNRCAWAAILSGLLCIAVSLLWPKIPNPRESWTEQKSSAFSDTESEVHGLSHALSDEMQHAAGDPNHRHTPNESTDPRLTALELEHAEERAAGLRKELEAAREIPAARHLLVGLIGMAFLVVGVLAAIGGSRRHDFR